MWTPCSPTGRFLSSSLMESLLFSCWKVAVPASSPVLVLRGTTTSFFGLAKAGTARSQSVGAAIILRIRQISKERLLVRIQKYLAGLRDAVGFVGKIWVMISVRVFPSFKFAVFLCLFGFVSTIASSVALAQQGRRG